MTCANHPDREHTAFCQNCGKPLCSECTRIVGSAVFCEPCLAAKISGATPPPTAGAGWQPVNGGNAPYGGPMPPVGPSSPNPGLAMLLGFIPGVGAMYNGQFAKGIVHLGIFAVLISLSDHVSGVFGILIAGWVFYMIFDAYQTAKARRDGTPLPDPFGLNDVGDKFGFGKTWPPAASGVYAPPATGPVDPGAGQSVPPPPPAGWSSAPYTNMPPPPMYGMPPVPPVDPHWQPRNRFPGGAVWLIGLGAVFLILNMSMFGHVSMGYLWPLLMIGFGVWIFVNRMTNSGYSLTDDGTADYRWRLMHAIRCSVWIIVTGALWLLDSLHILSWGNSWPIFFIVFGLLAIGRRMAYRGIHAEPYYASAPPPTYTAQPVEPAVAPSVEPVRNDEEQR